jgi:hypothetical protein
MSVEHARQVFCGNACTSVPDAEHYAAVFFNDLYLDAPTRCGKFHCVLAEVE